MRFRALAGLLALAAVIAAGCGDEGGETTVIRETADQNAAQAAERAEEKVEELEEQLNQAQRENENDSSDAAPVAAEPESEPVSDAPDVVGQRLDVAKRTLKGAGFSVRVSGGGVFGVLVDSNWVVCDQLPPSNEKVDVNVDRSC